MMKEKIKVCHELLNGVYKNCEELFIQVKNKYANAEMNSYCGHYIKINNKYEYQKYFMPVISIDDIGDICFNFDGISLEFFVDKSILLDSCDFSKLLRDYSVEIYDACDSMIDIYDSGMSLDLFIEKLKNWKSDTIGVTINCQDKNYEDILNIFDGVIQLLGVDKNG